MKYPLVVVLLVTLSSKISLQQCPPLRSSTLDFRCTLNNRQVSCDDDVIKVNTTASPGCKEAYQRTSQTKHTPVTCLSSGEWSDKPSECSPMCGMAKDKKLVSSSSIGGSAIKQPKIPESSQVPWQAGLYVRKMPDGSISPTWTMLCGGTLISNHLVLTAAHCLKFGIENTALKPEEIKVGLGKVQRQYTSIEPNAIISGVRDVLLPKNFVGVATNYFQDLALLDLEQTVEVSEFVLPACVDWSKVFKMNPGDSVHVSGWGRTEDGKPSEVLRVGEMTYLDRIDCANKFSPARQRYITPDKFCAESKPGSEPLNLQGSSGSGLTAVMDDRHYVIGVVSTQVRSQNKIIMFTNISNEEHHSWLESEKARLDNFHRNKN